MFNEFCSEFVTDVPLTRDRPGNEIFVIVNRKCATLANVWASRFDAATCAGNYQISRLCFGRKHV